MAAPPRSGPILRYARSISAPARSSRHEAAMADDLLLRISKLNASYGLARILFDLDLEIARGEVVALLGRNGAGKSTTLKSIIGLLPPRSGEIRFMGERIDGRPPHVIARLGIGYVP